MNAKRTIYQTLKISNDINAIRRGPDAVARRVAFLAYARLVNKLTRRIFK